MNNGTTIEASAQILPAGTKLRPLRDHLVIKPLDWDASSTVIAIRHGRPVRGRVVAAGPGTYWKRYSGDRSKYTESQQFRPVTVQIGDIVELGGLNVFDGQGYSFPEVLIDNERHLIVTEKDVAGVIEEEAA